MSATPAKIDGRTTRYPPLEVRFWSKVQKRGPDECWHWTGFRDKDGYGKFSIDHSTLRAAHRVSYALHYSKVYIGSLQVCHKCDTPSCVNPAHLFLGTQKDNIQDQISKGRYVLRPHVAMNKAKTHCKRGHEFTTENTYMVKHPNNRTGRKCIICKNSNERIRRAKKIAKERNINHMTAAN